MAYSFRMYFDVTQWPLVGLSLSALPPRKNEPISFIKKSTNNTGPNGFNMCDLKIEVRTINPTSLYSNTTKGNGDKKGFSNTLCPRFVPNTGCMGSNGDGKRTRRITQQNRKIQIIIVRFWESRVTVCDMFVDINRRLSQNR